MEQPGCNALPDSATLGTAWKSHNKQRLSAAAFTGKAPPGGFCGRRAPPAGAEGAAPAGPGLLRGAGGAGFREKEADALPGRHFASKPGCARRSLGETCARLTAAVRCL